MGAGSSKAAEAGARKFPKRALGAAPPRQPPTPKNPPRPASEQPRRQPHPATFSKDEAIRSDAANQSTVPTEFMSPAFAARLRELGAVQPNPVYSPSSTAGPRGPDAGDPQHSRAPASSYPSARDNVTLGVLEARRRLEEQADAEMENMGKSMDSGRTLLDVGTIRKVLLLRQSGERDADIEARLNLRAGVVRKLGPPGVVEAVQELSGQRVERR